jgi:hypothetical protein
LTIDPTGREEEEIMATSRGAIGTQYPNMADYVIVTDGPFDVSTGHSVTHTFLLPPSAVLTQTGRERPIVCYSLAGSDTATLRVHVQRGAVQEEVFTWVAPPELDKRKILQTIMEPITGTLLTTGGVPNTLVFSATGGEITVNNVIVLFQRSPAPGPVVGIGPVVP